ncbi:MAG: FAD-dependent oxidoreductase [Candidatus Woesearchaeota archaeon]
MTQSLEDTVVVVGAGISGLTAAYHCAKNGKQVVLVDFSDQVGGGVCEPFKRNGAEFNFGLHVVGYGNPLERFLLHHIMPPEVKWNQIPGPIDTLFFPDRDPVIIQPGRRAYGEAMSKEFPQYKREIKQFLRATYEAMPWLYLAPIFAQFPFGVRQGADFLRRINENASLTYVQDFLDTLQIPNELKAMLTAQWPYFGVDPSKIPMTQHAVVRNSFMGDCVYPEGGTNSIVDAVIGMLNQKSSVIYKGYKAVEIVMENDHVAGVRIQKKDGTDEQFIPTHNVISTIGEGRTFSLVPEKYKPTNLYTPNGSYVAGVSYVLNQDPRKLSSVQRIGNEGGSIWINKSYDPKQNAKLNTDSPPNLYLSFSSLKDPTTKVPCAEAGFFFSDNSLFAPWMEGNRDEDYKALKRRVEKGVTALIEQHIQGFSEIVQHSYVATPASFNRYGVPYAYGHAQTAERLLEKQARGFTPRTQIQGLFLGDAEGVWMPGVVPAAFSGYLAALQIVGHSAILDPAGLRGLF